MSVAVLGSYSVNYDVLDKEELEKCGDIFFERQSGNLIYQCTLCDDDKFKDISVFSKHITDMHLSVESFISYDPTESEYGEIEKFDPIEEHEEEEEFHEAKEIEVGDNEYQSASDESNMNNEEIYNIIDSSKTVLDIQVYDGNNQLELDVRGDEKDSHDLDSSEQLQAGIKPEILEENPIQIEEEAVEVNEMEDVAPEIDVADGLDAGDASDKEILRSKIKCKFCGEQFEYVKHLRKHDCGLKMGRKLHHCSVCSKVFKKKSGLHVHMMIHKGEKPHKCDICGAAYACKQNLIVHVRRHTGDKPFKCEFCERAFASSTEKISHMRTHTGERPFVCDMCGKAHTSSSQLTEHMHRHLDIRNYACEICEKRFRNSYNLRMHRLTHEDAPRKFTCEHCLSAFKTQSNLLQHVKIHQKVKKYVCKICGRAFAQHPGLYSHMKSHAIFK